jgi:DNA gyrase/topoisomerase IV subunit A
MRLRQLTNLDTEELVAENAVLDERLAALAILIEDRNARSTFCFKQMDEIAKRHGEARRSALIESPVAFTKVAATEKRELSAPKPRFMKVDMVKGMAEQAKGPRGALILEAKDKVVFVTESGVVKKVHAAYKGPISTEYGAIALARREAEVQQRRYLAVFKLEGKMRAMSLAGEDLCRTTSSGKNWLPDGAEFVSFGEGPVDLKWVSAKKQQGPITMANVKEGRPGAKGMLIANLSDLILG